ncbi:hypothetical protein HDU67_009671 [Dinochytrium kinnereticum]|nr:hypothetical protein HDU67_009671 [Dinochytrium kinnereticum]
MGRNGSPAFRAIPKSAVNDQTEKWKLQTYFENSLVVKQKIRHFQVPLIIRLISLK